MELNIYFKNVGQGDTIFLHWNDNHKFALIDCNLVGNDIATVILHIQRFNIKEFEFVIMSHPHTDHFSGFLQLFKYCQENKIIIRKFYHTAFFHPERLGQLLDKKITGNEMKGVDQIMCQQEKT